MAGRVANGLGLVLAAALAACGKSPTSAPELPTLDNNVPRAAVVPFVDCAQDGRAGPKPAPGGPPVMAQAMSRGSAAEARLAFYGFSGPAAPHAGVLGPRGWHCLGVNGPDGLALYLAPDPIQSSDVLADKWAAGAGPAIEARWTGYSGASGQAEVAQAAARLFPGRKAAPFPGDRTTVIDATTAEYQTAAGAKGAGTTFSRLRPSASPIDGVAIIEGPTPNLAFLAVRLPPEAHDLARPIVFQFEISGGGQPNGG
jgi:hypothetical protein